MAPLVFLGGTVSQTNLWRPNLIRACHQALPPGNPPLYELFDPVVKEWNAEARRAEERAKTRASIHFYYLASPRGTDSTAVSTYSLMEATMALYEHPDNTVVAINNEGITGGPRLSMDQAKAVLRTKFPNAVVDSINEALKILILKLVSL